MRFFKVTLPIMMAFVMACVAITSQFVSHHYSNSFVQETAYWSKVIGGVTMFIGAYSLLRVHYHKIKRGQKGWGYSALLYVFFGLMVFFGLLNYGAVKVGSLATLGEADAVRLAATTQPDAAAATGPASQPDGIVLLALTTEDGKPFTHKTSRQLFCLIDEKAKKSIAQSGALLALNNSDNEPLMLVGRQIYVNTDTGVVTTNPKKAHLGPLKPRTKEREYSYWIYEAVTRPASSTQYSLLGFFICSAAYRTFRAKTPEAAALLVAALIVMLGQVPIAEMIWDKIPVISGWLLDIPNMAVKRAILFGICVGSVGTALRVMFGIERSYMGGE